MSYKSTYTGTEIDDSVAFAKTHSTGTWQATLTASVTGPTYPVTVTGSYTKIGNQITAICSFVGVNTSGASGDMQVTGLPFTVGSVDCHGIVGQNSLGGAVLMCTAVAGTNILAIRDAATTVYTPIAAGAGKYLLIQITYIV